MKAKSEIQNAKEQIDEKTELWYLNQTIKLIDEKLTNARMFIKQLMKEKQLVINIKKKWNS